MSLDLCYIDINTGFEDSFHPSHSLQGWIHWDVLCSINALHWWACTAHFPCMFLKVIHFNVAGLCLLCCLCPAERHFEFKQSVKKNPALVLVFIVLVTRCSPLMLNLSHVFPQFLQAAGSVCLSSKMTQTDSGWHLLLIPAGDKCTEAARRRRGVHQREADVITVELKLLKPAEELVSFLFN